MEYTLNNSEKNGDMYAFAVNLKNIYQNVDVKFMPIDVYCNSTLWKIGELDLV